MGIFSYGQDDYPILEEISTEEYKKAREYFVCDIDSTNRYYVMRTIYKKDSAVLVVAKKSEQLEDIILQTNKTYTFNTYRHNDVVTPNALLCHYVDDRLVWCYEDGIELYFTDGMGNGFYENDEGW